MADLSRRSASFSDWMSSLAASVGALWRRALDINARIERHPLRWIPVVLLLCGLLVLATMQAESRIDDHRWPNDGAQYARIAYNLYKYNTFSLSGDESSSPEPTAYREPIVPFLVATLMYLDPAFSSDLSLEHILKGPLAERLKHHQLIIFALVPILVFLLTKRVKGSFIAAICAFWLTASSPNLQGNVNATSTELITALLLVLASVVFYGFATKSTIVGALILGITIALLALTRAAFLYFVPFLALAILSFRPLKLVATWQRAGALAAVAIIGFSIPVGAWSLRNHALFDSFSITQRGGSVLLFRALMNDINHDEFVGSFFVYTKDKPMRRWLSKHLGYSNEDLREGGRLQRLSRKLDISFYQRGRDIWSERRSHYKGFGYPDFAFRADEEIRRDAVRMIAANPWGHLKTSVVTAWRGHFIEEGLLINSLYVLSLFVVPLIALAKRDGPLLMVTLLPGFLFCFTTFLTHGLPRYNEPVLPMLTVLIVVMATFIVRGLASFLLPRGEALLYWYRERPHA